MAKNSKFYPDSFLTVTDSQVQLTPLANVVQDQQSQYKEQALKSIAAKRLAVISAIQSRRDGALIIMNSSLPQAYIGQKTMVASRADIAGKNGILTGGVNAQRTIDYVDFSAESITRSGLTLATNRYYHQMISSGSLAYAFGGDTASSLIEEFSYASKTSSTIAATLPFALRRAATISQKLAGYSFGGNSPSSPYISSIIKLTFATKAISTASANLSTSRQFPASVSSSTKAYICGGQNATYPLTIEAFTYGTEAIAAISAQLPNQRAYANGAGNTKAGYVTSDLYGNYVNNNNTAEISYDVTKSYAATISKITYTGESCSNLGFSFSNRIYHPATLNSGRAAYFCGGYFVYWQNYWANGWGWWAWAGGSHIRIQKLNYDNQGVSVIGTGLVSGNYGSKGASDYGAAL